MQGYATFKFDPTGATDLLPLLDVYCQDPRMSIIRGNCVCETSVERRNKKIVQEIMQNVANVFSFYAIIAIEHGFSI